MAKVSYVDVDPEIEDLFFSALCPGDRFVYSRLRIYPSLFSRSRKKGITQKSLLPYCSDLWAGLYDYYASFFGVRKYGYFEFGDDDDDGSKALWTAAGEKCNLNGWRLFVQDTCLRYINDLPGVSVPSLFHQSKIGYLHIAAPATEIKIAQYHPRNYYISHKVYGKKGMYVPLLITEDFALPLTIRLNYKSDLVSQGEGSFAKFYAIVRSSYQGADIYTNVEINFDLSADWKSAEATLTNVLGYVVGYTAYFHLYNLRGTLYVDNIELDHSGQNWTRDPYCKDLNQGFTRAFYQIPKHWVSVEMPSGSEFGSLFPT